MTMPRRPDDQLERLLDDDGGELGALYRRLPRAEPPRRLDRSVLAEAARAVHGTVRPRRQRWLVGFGSAAGLVLAAGVAWHVGHEALRQQEHEAARSAPTYVPVQPIQAPARKHEAATPADTAPTSAAPAPAAATPPSPANASGAAKARAAKPTVEKDAARPRGVPTPAPAAPPPPPAAAPEPQPILQSAPAPARAETEQREASGTAADSVAEAAAQPKQAADAQQKRERAAGTPALSSSAELRRDMQLAPELWLARIQQLLKQGRRQQASESLQLFCRAHPDWQLPDELRALKR